MTNLFIFFDSLAHTKKLVSVGFTQAQAETQMEILSSLIDHISEVGSSTHDDDPHFTKHFHSERLVKVGLTQTKADALVKFMWEVMVENSKIKIH